jgi:choline-sulfatase
MKVSRKQFLQTVAAAPLQAAQKTRASKSSGARPNVLILMSDQHRPDLMTCAGRDMVPTPHLDRIAEHGVRFTNAYCPYPVCVGSRTSFLTGLYAHHHGAVSNELSLDWRTRTIAHHFRDHGYVTGLIGKMHLNQPHLHGFDYHLGFNDWLMYLGPKTQLYANDIASHPQGPAFFKTVLDHGSGFPELPYLWSKGSPWAGKVQLNDKVASDLEAEDHIDAFVARESTRFLRQFQDAPFFLVAGFLKPHPPYHPPKEWAAKYPLEKMQLPAVGDVAQYPKHIQTRIQHNQALGEHRLRAGRSGYMGNLGFLDLCVGEVYKSLEELGLIDNTIVIYTSDHGDMDGDHGLWQKFVLYEPSVAVPLIVTYPKTIPQGKVSRALVEYMGIYPTLAELTGTGVPEGIDARSFAGAARNPGQAGPEAAFSEYDLGSAVPQYMIRTQRYKYIYNDGQIDELYDWEADPGEYVNRAKDAGMKRTRDRLRDQLFAWYDPGQNPYRPKSIPSRPV